MRRRKTESPSRRAVPAGAEKIQYPFIKYLSLLLAVTLLFSGVTFARYLTNDKVDASVGIAAFDATYSIDRVNTTSFGNQDYYITAGGTQIAQGAGTAITVGITLKNNGDTDVHPTLHLEGPADYWNNIALQLTTSRNIASDSVLTPQFVIADLVKKRVSEDDHDITYDGYKDWGTGGSFNTSDSDDFGSLGLRSTALTMSGGLTESGGTVTATWGGDAGTNTMTISAKEETRAYAVGFVREDDSGLLSPIYVDCVKEMTIYSIDIDLAALKVAAKQDKASEQGDKAGEQRIVVWLTWTKAAPNNSQAAKEDFWSKLATATDSFTIESDKITVTGYHFDVSGIPVVSDSTGETTGETTTVRVKQTFGGDPEYFHVETLEGDDGAYAHPLTHKSGYIYYCDNADPVYVSLANLANIADKFEDINMIRYDDTNTYAPIQQRAFGVSFSATFVQFSETP